VNFLAPVNPIEKIQGATKAGKELRFYNSEIHRAAFVLPTFVRRELESYTATKTSTEKEKPKESVSKSQKIKILPNNAILTAS